MPSVRDQYARKIIHESHGEYESLPGGGIPSLPGPDASVEEGARVGDFGDKEISIGIIGAGAAGLYIGMTLEKINKALVGAGVKPIKYEILEAESVTGTRPHPVGGRLWTHHFSDSDNDYYVCSFFGCFSDSISWSTPSQDRGAMRYPDHPPMKPVMDLFDELGLQRVKIPYIMTTDANVNLFNSTLCTNAEVEEQAAEGRYDPFGTEVVGLNGKVDDMVKRQIKFLRNKLVEDFDKGWEELMKYDAWSTRGFMTIKGGPSVGPYSKQVRHR